MKFLRLALLIAAVSPTAVRTATPGTSPAADNAPGAATGEALARENRQLADDLARAQAALAKQAAEVATVRDEAASTRLQLTKTQSELAAARNGLASQGGAAQVTPNLNGALERERTAHLATKAMLAQRESQVQDLIASRTTVESENRVMKAATEAAKNTPTETSARTLAQNAELNAKVATLNRSLLNGHSEISSLRQELRNQTSKTTADAEVHAREVATLQEKLTLTRNELNQAKSDLDATTQSTTAATAAAAAAAKAQSEAQLAALRTQVEGLERELQAATANVRRFAATQARFESVQQEAIETRRQLDAATKELQTLREKPANASGDLTVARLELAQARNALAAATSQSAASKLESEAQVAKLQAEVARLQREAQQTSTRASAAEITQPRDALAKSETSPKMSAADVAAIQIQERQLAALEQELSAARSQLTQTNAALDAAAQSAASSIAAKTEAETQLAQVNADKAALQRDLDAVNTAAQQQSAAHTAENARLQVILARSSPAASVPVAELEAAQRNAAEDQRRLTAAREEIDSLRAQVAAAGELEKRVRQLEAEKAALDNRPREPVAASQEELDRATAAQAAAEDKLATALRAYTLLARERDQLRAQVIALSSQETPKVVPTVVTTSAPVAVTFDPAPTASPAPAPEVAPPPVAVRPNRSPLPAARTASLGTASYQAAPVRPPRPVVPPGQPALSHRIANGETLSSIARLYYGNPARWTEIVAANRDVLPDQRSFCAGRMLRIP